MNAQHRALTFAVVSAGCLLAVAACSSGSGGSGSPTTPPASPTGTPSVLPIQEGITQGATCSPANAPGVTRTGVAMVCQKDSAGQLKWTSAVTDVQRAKSGLFCANNGQTTTTTVDGVKVTLVCRPGVAGRLRWTQTSS